MDKTIFKNPFLIELWEKIRNSLSQNPPRIIFPEGTNPLIQKAASKLAATKQIICQLLFKTRTEIPTTLAPEIECLVIEEQDLKKIATEIHHYRAKKWTFSQTYQFIQTPYYFAAAWLKLGKSDALVGGVDCPTSDLIRPALQIIGANKETSLVSSAFLMMREKECFIFTDCAMNPNPDADQLMQIGWNAAQLAHKFAFLPVQLAFLSFSTNGSGGNFPSVIKVREAQEKIKKYHNNWFSSIGEVQFDASFSSIIRQKKLPNNLWTKPANVYVFPDLNSGNIGYKIAQELGGFQTFGPILIGLKKPVFDLSRGANQSDIEGTILFAVSSTL